jgi:hypothetical protein
VLERKETALTLRKILGKQRRLEVNIKTDVMETTLFRFKANGTGSNCQVGVL